MGSGCNSLSDGWMSALIAPYVKKVYKNTPCISESKVIISIYDDSFSEYFSEMVVPNIVMDDLSASDLSQQKGQKLCWLDENSNRLCRWNYYRVRKY